jgi:hypothetical protein
VEYHLKPYEKDSQDSVTYVADRRFDSNCKNKVGEPGASFLGGGGVSLLLHDIEPFDFSVQGAG